MPEPADEANPTSTPPPLRASDADRAATVQVLQDAVTRGLLTTDEASERMAAAFAAVHLHELPPLTADLPPLSTRPTAPGWRPLAVLAVEQVRASARDVRAGRVTPARLAATIAVAVLLVVALGALVAGIFGGGPGYHVVHHG